MTRYFAEPAVDLYIDPTCSYAWFRAISDGVSKRTTGKVIEICCPASVSITATIPADEWPDVKRYLDRVLPLADRTRPKP